MCLYICIESAATIHNVLTLNPSNVAVLVQRQQQQQQQQKIQHGNSMGKPRVLFTHAAASVLSVRS